MGKILSKNLSLERGLRSWSGFTAGYNLNLLMGNYPFQFLYQVGLTQLILQMDQALLLWVIISRVWFRFKIKFYV